MDQSAGRRASADAASADAPAVATGARSATRMGGVESGPPGLPRSALELRVSQVRRAAGQTAAPGLRASRRYLAWLAPSSTGLVVGVLFFCISLTPSLLPRPWLAQGLISGVSLSSGYAIGVVLGWLGREGMLLRPRVVPDDAIPFSEQLRTAERAVGRSRRWAQLRVPLRRTVKAASFVLVALALYQGSTWQHDLFRLMGLTPPDRIAYLRGPLVALGVLTGAVVLVRGLRRVVRFLVRVLRAALPAGPIQFLGVTAGLLLAISAAEWVALGGFLTAASSLSSAVNDAQRAGITAPTSPLRSGSPASLVSWDSLGNEGRSFVSGGPTLAELRAFDGDDVEEPVRVYVGLKSAPGTKQAAALAVRELERTGAFSRSVLCVVTTTGTGWIDPYLAAALEYLHHGDTAIVGVQYSYLPSWISFLSQRDRVKQAGPELFNQVYAAWSTLPAGHRPQLVVFAESLGSLGSEAGFHSLADVRARTQGVLWTGPTHANPLWEQFVTHRDPGSPEVLPVYHRGEQVRFASHPADLTRPPTPWSRPRVVYLQNPSDPVTWWTPDLLWRRPDWLAEPRGDDVLPAMHWYPVVTFLQMTADLALAYGAPPGHGHRFHTAAVAAWAAITPVSGWTDERSAVLTRLLGP